MGGPRGDSLGGPRGDSLGGPRGDSLGGPRGDSLGGPRVGPMASPLERVRVCLWGGPRRGSLEGCNGPPVAPRVHSLVAQGMNPYLGPWASPSVLGTVDQTGGEPRRIQARIKDPVPEAGLEYKWGLTNL